MGNKISAIRLIVFAALTVTTRAWGSPLDHDASSVDVALSLFSDVNAPSTPYNLHDRETTLRESQRQFSLDFVTATEPDRTREQIPSWAMDVGFAYGWTDFFETDLILPRLVQYDGTEKRADFFREVDFAAHYRVFHETRSVPSVTLGAGLAGLDDGLGIDGSLLIEKRIAWLRANLTVSGRHRIHYSAENYGFVAAEPQIGAKLSERFFLGTGFKTTRYFDSQHAHAADMVAGRSGAVTDGGPSTSLALTPLAHFALTRRTDLIMRGTITLNPAARETEGHRAELGFSFRL